MAEEYLQSFQDLSIYGHKQHKFLLLIIKVVM